MRFFLRVFVFIFLFSLLFFFIRTSEILSITILLENLNGVSWLYSTIGLIFGIVSAFIIQTEWDKWDRLHTAVREETGSLRQLLLLARHFPDKIELEIKKIIGEYLHLLIQKEWEDLDKGKKSQAIEKTVYDMQEILFNLPSDVAHHSDQSFTIFAKILTRREDRLHYSAKRLPVMLKTTIVFATSLIIGLSLFIGVKSMLLDYLFTMGIALLAFLIYTVISDLEHPLRPGNWHITTDEYKDLLNQIKSS